MAGVGGGFHVVACATSRPHLRGCFVALPNQYARQVSGASSDGGVATLKLEWHAPSADDSAADQGEARTGPDRTVERKMRPSAISCQRHLTTHPCTHPPADAFAFVGWAGAISGRGGGAGAVQEQLEVPAPLAHTIGLTAAMQRNSSKAAAAANGGGGGGGGWGAGWGFGDGASSSSTIVVRVTVMPTPPRAVRLELEPCTGRPGFCNTLPHGGMAGHRCRRRRRHDRRRRRRRRRHRHVHWAEPT